MDIILQSEPDGIEAARMIQNKFPQISVIFVTAYAGNPIYRERAERSRVRVADWIEKPVHRAMPELIQLINKEMIKSTLRERIAAASAQGISPVDYLQSLQSPDVSPEITQELLDEHSRLTDP
jgi:CheY-like chemotaxis protein